MLNVLCFWFGALLAGLDSLILAAFAQMKQSVRNRLVVGQANFVRPTFLRRELSFIFGASGFSDHNYRLNDFFNGTVGLQPFGAGPDIAGTASDLTLYDHIPHSASARARRQATGRIEPRAERQQQSEIEVS